MGARVMKAREIEERECGAYEAVARECGTIFHTTAWTSLVGKGLKRVGVFSKSDELVAGFHYFRSGPAFARYLRNPPCTPMCGPFLRCSAKNPVAVLELRRNVLTALASFLRRPEFALISLSLGRDIDDALPFVWSRFKVVPRYTYLIDLRQSRNARMGSMSVARRNDLSKATRDGLAAVQANDYRVVRELVRDGFIRNGLGGNDELLDAIFGQFAKPENCYGFVTMRNDEPLAAAFVIHDKRTAYYILGGYRATNGHHGAGALALANAIEHAAELGLEVFDFEGSMIPAIERYFRGFGGKLHSYFTVNRAWLPLELMLKLYKRHIF